MGPGTETRGAPELCWPGEASRANGGADAQRKLGIRQAEGGREECFQQKEQHVQGH